HIMTPYPQLMINLKTTAENKLKFYTDKRVKEAIEESKKVLGDEGRVVVRPSGTEPLIRVMAEGSDLQMIEAEANKIAEVLCKQLGCE
ncbi:MAG TPA: phosphoglucosamine mutase, partial [Clostridiales bacterium]|nr:phosphoglucosamine mutase [Clostridiales bacterium]